MFTAKSSFYPAIMYFKLRDIVIVLSFVRWDISYFGSKSEPLVCVCF